MTPPDPATTRIKLGCLRPWQQQEEKYTKLAAEASTAAQEIASDAPYVWILSHEDTAHFAAQLGKVLTSQNIRALTYAQSAEDDVKGCAATLLAAEVVIVVYCQCIFDLVCCQQLVRLCADNQIPCIVVYYKVMEKEMREFAIDAAGLKFANKIFDGNIVVKHKGIRDSSGGTLKLARATMLEVGRAVRNIILPSLAASESPDTSLATTAAACGMQAAIQMSGDQMAGAGAAAASTASPAVPTSGTSSQPPPAPVPASTATQAPRLAAVAATPGASEPGAAASNPFNMWLLQASTMLQIQQQLMILQHAMALKQQGVPPFPMVGDAKFKTIEPCLADHGVHSGEVAVEYGMQPFTADLSSATGTGCILTVVELPAGTLAGPMYLYRSVRTWAAVAAAAGGPGAATTRVFAASAGNSMVAWCQQGWGVWLPPGAPDAPHVSCPAPILAADLDSDGVTLRLHLGWGDVSSSSGGASSSSRLSSLHIIVKSGLMLHTLPLAEGPEAAVTVPPDVLLFEDLLLLTVADAKQYFYNESAHLLVLEADTEVITELNSM
eukprot:GHUV01012908.1.p1 GENE.GHUV01012908.1~~GHUV01012908.1.p1  ORF type:complete len:552 (+),score=191.93 GHUV01012908.1:1295-2950(+)